MLTALDMIGTAAFAASGASIGVYKRLDLFGVAVVGVCTGIGGGIVRDLLLGLHPPFSLDNPRNITVALVFALIVFLLHPAVGRARRLVLVLDAVGMGVFATTGADIALSHGSTWWAAIVIGMITAIGGGVLRDMLVNEMPLLLHRDLYATPALLGAGLFIAADAAGLDRPWSLGIGIVVATGLRLAALRFDWNLPRPPQFGRAGGDQTGDTA